MGPKRRSETSISPQVCRQNERKVEQRLVLGFVQAQLRKTPLEYLQGRDSHEHLIASVDRVR